MGLVVNVSLKLIWYDAVFVILQIFLRTSLRTELRSNSFDWKSKIL